MGDATNNVESEETKEIFADNVDDVIEAIQENREEEFKVLEEVKTEIELTPYQYEFMEL